jgi:hypothetical protein
VSGSDQKGKLAEGFTLPKPPPRTPVEVPEAEAFTRKEKKQPRQSRKRRVTAGERVSGYVPPELAESVRERCFREKRSLSDALTEALGAWVKRR